MRAYGKIEMWFQWIATIFLAAAHLRSASFVLIARAVEKGLVCGRVTLFQFLECYLRF